MQNIDMLIHARWIVSVDADNTIYENHTIAVHEGKIKAILPTAESKQHYHAEQSFQLDSHALIPGLINAHTHASMTLFRGLADDMPLMDWLQKHIWPAEAKWVNEEFVRDGTLLAAAEMLRGGTTLFNEMYFFPDIAARVADSVGMRACIGLILLDFPTAWAADADEYLRKGLEVHDHFRGNTRILTAFAPHAPYTVSDGPLQKIVTLAEELDIPIHMHVHETAFEVEQALQNGQRPLERLHRLGLLSPRLLAVHMTQLNASDIQLVHDTGTHVIHCPESNLKLASGFCPTQKLLDANCNVALGTDGAASNNDLDLLGEMRTAALIAKNVANDASALSATDALRCATINGAKALGMDHVIGSLEAGKSADIVAIDLSSSATQPVYHVTSQIVYSCTRDHVTHTWITGECLLNNRSLTTIDEAAVIRKATQWAEKILRADEHAD